MAQMLHKNSKTSITAEKPRTIKSQLQSNLAAVERFTGLALTRNRLSIDV